jgi:hypothetical protein
MPKNHTPTISTSPRVRQGKAKAPAVTIDKTEGRKIFAGPATFQATGGFADNGFKGKDVSR